ncbi:hypothetical protein GCM10010232_66030 [Streptomyces amakusaensis]|uniref:Uncharacterized protein n=1 Tax=Streptomyces amakusaensis TaxID=67271 RepID=A0ABW0ARP8_9ACTN
MSDDAQTAALMEELRRAAEAQQEATRRAAEAAAEAARRDGGA